MEMRQLQQKVILPFGKNKYNETKNGRYKNKLNRNSRDKN